MGVSPACMSVCAPCACNACGGQKAASDPLELESPTIVNRDEDASIEPGPLDKQQELLTAKQSLYPRKRCFVRTVTWGDKLIQIP